MPPPNQDQPSSTTTTFSKSPLASGIEIINSLWKSNKWIVVSGFFLIAVIAGLFSVLLSFLNQSEPTTSAETPDKQQQEVESGIATTKASDDDTFFAKLSHTIIYYSFAQTTNNKNMVQATPQDHENRVIPIGFPDKHNFNTSPDGKWLIRWDDTKIERASADKPATLTTIFESSSNRRINSVKWQSDSSTIALTTTKDVEEGSVDTPEYESKIIIIPQLTLDEVDLYTATSEASLELVNFPNSNSLYFQKNASGQITDLSLFNPHSKEVERVFSDYNQDNMLSRMVFDQQMRYGYITTDLKITQHTLEDPTKSTTIHSINTSCSSARDIKDSKITGLSLSPTGNSVIFTEEIDYCQKEWRDAERNGKELPTSRLSHYSNGEREVLKKIDNASAGQIDADMWSGDEKYVWITSGVDSAFIMTLEDYSFQPIPNPNRQTLTKERVFPIGWLQPSGN